MASVGADALVRRGWHGEPLQMGRRGVWIHRRDGCGCAMVGGCAVAGGAARWLGRRRDGRGEDVLESVRCRARPSSEAGAEVLVDQRLRPFRAVARPQRAASLDQPAGLVRRLSRPAGGMLIPQFRSSAPGGLLTGLPARGCPATGESGTVRHRHEPAPVAEPTPMTGRRRHGRALWGQRWPSDDA